MELKCRGPESQGGSLVVYYLILVKTLRFMCAGLSTGMVRSPHIRAFLLESTTTFIFLLPSSSMAPTGNGTAVHHNVGTTPDLGHHLSQVKTAPAMRTTQH